MIKKKSIPSAQSSLGSNLSTRSSIIEIEMDDYIESLGDEYMLLATANLDEVDENTPAVRNLVRREKDLTKWLVRGNVSIKNNMENERVLRNINKQVERSLHSYHKATEEVMKDLEKEEMESEDDDMRCLRTLKWDGKRSKNITAEWTERLIDTIKVVIEASQQGKETFTREKNE